MTMLMLWKFDSSSDSDSSFDLFFNQILCQYMWTVLDRLTRTSQRELLNFGFSFAITTLGDFIEENQMINQVMFDFQRLNVVGMDEALRLCLGTVINLEMHGNLVNDLESISDPNNYSVDFYVGFPTNV